MLLSDFDFDLPKELIAIRPVNPRSSARLLVAKENKICDSFVDNLPKFLKSGDRLVFNDTKVLPARLNGVRSRSIESSEKSSAKIEVTLLAPKQKGIWSALIKPLRKVKLGETIHFNRSFEDLNKNFSSSGKLSKFKFSRSIFSNLSFKLPSKYLNVFLIFL